MYYNQFHSDPEADFRIAEPRMLLHREQLVEIGGLRAEQLQPEWCLQNEGVCPMADPIDALWIREMSMFNVE